MGVDLPMVWTTELDDLVVTLGDSDEETEPDPIQLAGLTVTPTLSQSASSPATPAASPPSGGFDLYVHGTYVPVPDPTSIFKWVLGILALAVVIVATTSWWLLRKNVS